MKTRFIFLLAFLCAFTGYGQNIRVTTLQASGITTGGLTNQTRPFTNSAISYFGGYAVTYALGTNKTSQYFEGGGVSSGGWTNSGGGVRNSTWSEQTAGVTNRSATATRQDAPLLINGGFSLVPTLIAAVGSVNQATNAYQWWTTNADFQVLFGGTPVEGSRGQFDIKNTGATNITVTWPVSWSIAQAALITSFIASSNAITEVFWYYEGGSNRVRVATKEIIENFTAPTAGQVVGFHDAHTKTNLTVSGTGDVTAAANFAVDNVAIRSDGTGKGVQRSGVTIDDSDNIRANAITTTNFISGTGLTNAGVSYLTGGATILQSANDPDVTVEGSLTWDANGDVLRAFDGTAQVAVARKIEAIHVTVVLPNDLADSERDAFWVWENVSGMSFIVTGWSAKSDTDDTTLNIEEIDNDGANNATVDAVEIATNGTGLFYASDSTITAATIENGHLLVLDFDDTDTPGQVKITIFGYFDANVN